MSRPTKILAVLAIAFLPPALALGIDFSLAEGWDDTIPTGLVDGELQPCPPGVDCVSSVEEDAAVRVEPLPLGEDARADFDRLVALLTEVRQGALIEREEGYARLVVWTPFLKMADELELRLDEQGARAQVRAFSRIDVPDAEGPRSLVASLRRAWGLRRPGPEPPES